MSSTQTRESFDSLQCTLIADGLQDFNAKHSPLYFARFRLGLPSMAWMLYFTCLKYRLISRFSAIRFPRIDWGSFTYILLPCQMVIRVYKPDPKGMWDQGVLRSIPLTTPEQGFVPLIIQSSLVDDATIHLRRCKLRAEPLIRSLFIGPGEGGVYMHT